MKDPSNGDLLLFFFAILLAIILQFTIEQVSTDKQSDAFYQLIYPLRQFFIFLSSVLLSVPTENAAHLAILVLFFPHSENSSRKSIR